MPIQLPLPRIMHKYVQPITIMHHEPVICRTHISQKNFTKIHATIGHGFTDLQIIDNNKRNCFNDPA